LDFFFATLQHLNRNKRSIIFFDLQQLTKIFIYPLLLAWSIIFAHDTIPHHHESSYHTEIQGALHHHEKDAHDNEVSHFGKNDHNHCHFSVTLLRNFSLDHNFFSPQAGPIHFQVPNKIISYPKEFITQKWNSVFLEHIQLRAPPFFA
jgi:hypothetical protein